jgi:pSer/pThr/pTyr-binding forkhead associated (FHA) protein
MDKIHLKIGRFPENDLVIESEGVDPYHLELFCDIDGNVFITDLNTKNGTYINGEELNGYSLLKKGDKVILGRHYVFRWESFIRSEESEKKIESAINELNSPKNNQSSNVKPIVNDEVSNKQLFLIYGAILLVIILMFFLL